MRLVLAAAAAVAAVTALAVPAAEAARECDGLDVCIRVPGPWVAVPAARRGAPSTAYRLSCPRGSVAGGVDAVRDVRTVDVAFLGALGSPVNPGITTKRDVVFVATSAAARVAVFRPLLGCIPTSGGGGRRTTAVGAVAPRPGVVRRVRGFRLGPAGVTGTVACPRGERLLSASYAVAFRTRIAPSARTLAGVSVRLRLRPGRATTVARRGSAVPAGVRVELQVHALCGAVRR